MKTLERRGGIPGAGSAEPPARYTWRARLGFVICGLAVVGLPLLLWFVPSQAGLQGARWTMAGLWWTLVAGYTVAVTIVKITRRSERL